MTWKGVILGFLIGIVALPIAAWAYLKLGYAPVATSAPPMPFETYFAKSALHARVFADAPHTDPVPATESNLMDGAQLYRENCAFCHGLPTRSETAMARGMFPKPPQLLEGKGVTDDPAGVTYWKIQNGIRLTGMPGFQNSLSDEQMWRIANLLANADKLPAAVQDELKRPDSITVASLAPKSAGQTNQQK
jgi:thiosulfate dehydrogenase